MMLLPMKRRKVKFETSNDREIVEYEEITVSKKTIKSYGELSSSVLSNYSELIAKRAEQAQQICFQIRNQG